LRFDKTYISIRQRSALEIMDLALHVIRDNWLPLLGLLLLGAMPWALLNDVMLGWMCREDYAGSHLPLYVFDMVLAVASQSQLGTVLITNYVGHALFIGRPSIWRTIRGTLVAIPGLILLHGLLRLVLVTVILLVVWRSDQNIVTPDERAGQTFWLFLATGCAMLVRAFRPFASEILILEKTPIWSNSKDGISYSRRSRSLHSPAASELLGRFLLHSGFACLLSLTIYMTLVSLDSILGLHNAEGFPQVRFFWPLSLWIVACVMAVVRFLSYIDIRIRQEGWAVELRMRSEANRLTEATR
jgi:hypothetical protein